MAISGTDLLEVPTYIGAFFQGTYPQNIAFYGTGTVPSILGSWIFHDIYTEDLQLDIDHDSLHMGHEQDNPGGHPSCAINCLSPKFEILSLLVGGDWNRLEFYDFPFSLVTGTMEFWMTFQKQLGMSPSQLTFTPSFFRGLNHWTTNQSCLGRPCRGCWTSQIWGFEALEVGHDSSNIFKAVSK